MISIMKSVFTAIVLFLPLVHATNYQVEVGFNGLIYTPNSVAANAGDTLEFLFEGVPLPVSYFLVLHVLTIFSI